MRQFKIENKELQTFLVYLLKDKEEVDQACYEIIHDKQIPGFLPTFISTKENKQCLKFNTSSRIRVSEFLDEQVRKKDFLQVFSSIVENLKRCEAYSLDTNNILLDSSYIYVNKETREAELLYCPVIWENESEDIRSRLKSFVLKLDYASSDNALYASKITKYLEQESSFSMDGLKRLLEELKVEEEKELGKLFQAGKIKMPTMNLTQSKQPEPAQENWVGPRQKEIESEENNPRQTKELSDDNVKNEDTSAHLIKAVLRRKKTGEEILIYKQVFKIGTEKDFVDYCIEDNPTISRSHANIVIENEEYYIMDMNSKNYTIVNGRLLVGARKVKLIHGSSILLADEEFEFSLEL